MTKEKTPTGTLVVIRPDGKREFIHVDKPHTHRISEIIGSGCSCVCRIKVRYMGKVRDCYLDDDGFRNQPFRNFPIKKVAEAYYGRPCQDFMGAGVIWIPNHLVNADTVE